VADSDHRGKEGEAREFVSHFSSVGSTVVPSRRTVAVDRRTSGLLAIGSSKSIT
jgi:hypothetical protein